MPNIETLNLSGNKLSSTLFMRHLLGIKELNFSQNHIL
jgi:hypothetical protein